MKNQKTFSDLEHEVRVMNYLIKNHDTAMTAFEMYLDVLIEKHPEKYYEILQELYPDTITVLPAIDIKNGPIKI